jgi:prolyl-tRNA editing enzyme YbaK/EbsC (Cys-tRNA(Pro) deacylase)
VIADETISGLGTVAIGGGGHGVNLHVAAAALVEFLQAELADVTKPDDR